MRFSGMSPDGLLPEIIEYADHPWFIGVQFHPELKSRPVRAASAVLLLHRGGGGAEPARVTSDVATLRLAVLLVLGRQQNAGTPGKSSQGLTGTTELTRCVCLLCNSRGKCLRFGLSAPYKSLIAAADSVASLSIRRSSREAKSQVQVLRSALILRRAVGRGRFSVTCQAVEIGHQGSVSFKFSQAFHQLIANR